MNDTYPGIDYGRGLANIDSATGIRYGVISQNSVSADAVDEILDYGTDVAWEAALKDVINEARDRAVVEGEDPDYVDEDEIRDRLGDTWETNFANYEYDSGGYRVTGCLDNDLFVLRSPFFTFAQFCSPCVPGAGNLDTPFMGLAVPHYDAPGWAEDFIREAEANGFPRVFALGHNWFEDQKVPYVLFSVATGKLCATNNSL
jgi:hypothetical protein